MARRAVAEINLAAIERNAATLCSYLQPGAATQPGGHTRHGAELCAVVKADGYGHGAIQAAQAALAGGATSLAVASAPEAATLREELRAAGVDAPLLILGAISDEELPLAVAADCTLVAWDIQFVESVARTARARRTCVRLCVKLDTGLGRLGTRDPQQAILIARAIKAATPDLVLSGAMTHFATADEDDLTFTEQQIRRFEPFVRQMREIAGPDCTVHACNSAGTLRLPHAHYDMVRAGIALYGADPMNVDPSRYGLEPALTLRSYVAAVKRAEPGDSIGYGRRFIAREPTMIATLPIGYGDGLPRRLANNLDVLIGGRRYPLCGMVSMDNITVDVGPDTAVAVGQQATIIGSDGDQSQTAEDIAHRLDTISYEVLCQISRRVPRVYHRDGMPG